MKTIKSFDEAGLVAKEYVDAETKRFLETNKEIVAKVSEPAARAIFASQIASHMYAMPSNEIQATIAEAAQVEPEAVHELRQRAAHAAVAFAPMFSRMFGVLAMETVAAS
jgi:hypothetical protein